MERWEKRKEKTAAAETAAAAGGSTTSNAIMKEHSWPNRVATEIKFQLLRPELGVSLYDDRAVAVSEERTLHLESYH